MACFEGSPILPHLHHNNILSNLIRAYFKIKWYSCIVLTPWRWRTCKTTLQIADWQPIVSQVISCEDYKSCQLNRTAVMMIRMTPNKNTSNISCLVLRRYPNSLVRRADAAWLPRNASRYGIHSIGERIEPGENESNVKAFLDKVLPTSRLPQTGRIK